VRLDNFVVVNAILFVTANGCKWRALPAHYGPWHTVYTRMGRWAQAGVLDRLFEHLQRHRPMRVRIEAISPDSTLVKVHPDGTGALEKAAPTPSAAAGAAGAPGFIGLPRPREMSSPGA
jgi:transposase